MQKSELQYFKDLLLERKEQILKNISAVDSELKELNSYELNDEGDHASTINSLQLDDTLMFKQQEELHEIEHALYKISHGGYGSCEMCDDDIGFARLKAKPHARYCIVCRPLAEKSALAKKN